MVESQCAEEQLTKTQEYFCTNSTFQCSDCFDIETFLWRMAGRNTAQSNLNPRAGSNSLAPQWLQSGSVLEAPEHFWRVFCKGMREITQIYSTLALTPPLPATIPFRRLIGFCFASFQSSPVTSEYFPPSFHSLSLISDSECGTAMLMLPLIEGLEREAAEVDGRGRSAAWDTKAWNKEHQRSPDSILWEKRHSFSLWFTRLRNTSGTGPSGLSSHP